MLSCVRDRDAQTSVLEREPVETVKAGLAF